MSKVSELKFGGPRAGMGSFHVRKFNMFETGDMEDYAELRNRANNLSSGVRVENIREVGRRTVIREGGEDGIVTTQDDLYLFVQYWEKSPESHKEDTDEETEQEKNLLTVASR